ncbi:proline--tRNA ligase [Alicyclobacillus acidoterrestris]|nr:proline--tRNA ligase [Alicyclobacillus acidoterrestris]
MKMSHLVLKTERQVPADAQLVSHQLLIRAGFVRRVSAGIYTYGPLAVRVLHHIEAIAREEMNALGGQEVLFPVVQPAGLWEQSGRLLSIGSDLARWTDRAGAAMVLAMTHEETATDFFRSMVQSYRALPLMMYQIQTKFRDEPRPRGGLIRLREFLMKDAYSFHRTVDDLNAYYAKVLEAYGRFFKRCDLDIVSVESDTGMMGGGMAHEFMFLSPMGEDTLLICDRCGYAANREVAVAQKSSGGLVCDGLQVKVYRDGGGGVMGVVVPGHLDVNPVKLTRAVGMADLAEVAALDIARETAFDVRVVVDEGVDLQSAWTAIAAHLGDLSARAIVATADITNVSEGMACGRCGGILRAVRGIEAGNTFKLGTKYSQAMGALVTDADGRSIPAVMGCYGIGITRVLACILEQHHDAAGMMWPRRVAPYAAHIVSVGDDAAIVGAAENVYQALGVENAIWDDRVLRPGIKFSDADLFGMPTRITVSARSLAAGGVELRDRRTGQTTIVPMENVRERVLGPQLR